MVIWLLGISGSGKSTLGEKLKQKLDRHQINNTLIDGDKFRNFFDNDLGYAVEDRRENIKRIISAAKMAEELKHVTIVCNISPFQDLRNFCKYKFNQYIEIFLDRQIEEAIKDDVKKIYKKSKLKNIIGFDIKFDIPQNPI